MSEGRLPSRDVLLALTRLLIETNLTDAQTHLLLQLYVDGNEVRSITRQHSVHSIRPDGTKKLEHKTLYKRYYFDKPVQRTTPRGRRINRYGPNPATVKALISAGLCEENSDGVIVPTELGGAYLDLHGDKPTRPRTLRDDCTDAQKEEMVERAEDVIEQLVYTTPEGEAE